MSNGKLIDKLIDDVAHSDKQPSDCKPVFADCYKLDEAIKYYGELAKERYTNTAFYENMYRWLMELRERRKWS